MFDNLDSAFLLTMATLVFGFLGVSVRLCLKSKCDDCSICFGLIQIHRNVDAELQEEKIEIENNIVSV
jgi:hypothetical protein